MPPRAVSWSTEQDNQLAVLLNNNTIQASKEQEYRNQPSSYREYLWQVSQEHFLAFSGNKERSIRRLRDKIRNWNLNVTLAGVRRLRDPPTEDNPPAQEEEEDNFDEEEEEEEYEGEGKSTIFFYLFIILFCNSHTILCTSYTTRYYATTS